MKQFSSRLGAVALSLLVTIATLAIAFPVSAQDSSVTEIDSCTEITEPGAYVLTDDIENSEEDVCLSVAEGTEDVAIDGDGHTVDGVDAESTIGIDVGGFNGGTQDVTIEDIVLTDWSLGSGFVGVNDGTIHDVTVESSATALVVIQGGDVEVSEVTLTENERGIVTLGGSTTIVDTVVSSEVDYSSVASEDDGAPDNTAENVTLDTAVVSFEDDFDQVDFFGGGAGVDLSAVESAPDDPEGLSNIGQYVEADSDSNAGGSFALDVHYNDEDLPNGVKEDSLRLYQFTDGEWTEVPGSEVDTDANTVSTEFDDPSVFDASAVLAPLGQADEDGDDSGVIDIGAKDITIDLGDITIGDFDLSGPSLSDEYIDHRTYEVGGFDIEIDGFDLTIGDTDYRVGHITIDIEPFDVILEDVTLGNGE